MPGSPERATSRTRTSPRRSSPQMRASVGPRQAALPGPAGRVHRVDGARATSATRSSTAASPVTEVVIGRGRADGPAHRAGRGDRDRRRAVARAPARAGDAAARSTGSATALSLILYSMPYFVIGMPLIIIFAAGLRLVPDLGDDRRRAATRRRSRPLLDLAPPPRPAADRGGARPHRRRTRSSCARRSSRPAPRTTSRRPGRRACRTAGSSARTRSRTRCCRWSR